MTVTLRLTGAFWAICLAFAATQPALAATVTIYFALSGPATTAGGLVVAADPGSGTVSREMTKGQSLFFPLFTLWTDERSIGPDDLVPRSLFADVSLPDYGSTARLSGSVQGHSEFFDIFQWGTVHWETPLDMTFGDGGRLKVSLQNAIFNFGFSRLAPGRVNGADIIATVTLVRQPAAVDLPAPLGLGVLALCALGLVRARARAGAVPA